MTVLVFRKVGVYVEVPIATSHCANWSARAPCLDPPAIGASPRASTRSRFATDWVSDVQFVRFPLGGLDQDAFLQFAADGKIAIEVDHPRLSARAPITGPIAKALASDLSDR